VFLVLDLAVWEILAEWWAHEYRSHHFNIVKVKGKGKGKVHPRTGHEALKGE
jgi:hypothetical protein